MAQDLHWHNAYIQEEQDDYGQQLVQAPVFGPAHLRCVRCEVEHMVGLTGALKRCVSCGSKTFVVVHPEPTDQ